jgi:hypothetical protein
MSTPRRHPARRKVALLTLAVLAMALVVWFGLRRGQPSPMTVTITTDVTSTSTGGRVALAAAARDARGQRVEGASFVWSVTAGKIEDQGRKVTWVAPDHAGPVTITVVASAAAHAEAKGTIQLDVHGQGAIEPVAGSAAGGQPLPPAEGEFTVEGYGVDDVTLDRTAICKNEDVRVRIKAHDPHGDDAWLTASVVINGVVYTGLDVIARPSIAFVRGLSDEGASGTIEIQVHDTRTPRMVARRLVKLDLQDCAAPTGGLRVECAHGVDRPDDFVCAAEPWEATDDPSSFVPTSFRWSLLDGVPAPGLTEQTRSSSWRVLLPPMVQTRANADLLVEVVATDAKGQTRVGRTSIAVANPEYIEASNLGTLALQVAQDPAPSQGRGDYIIEVDVTNPFPEDIQLDGATLSTYACVEGAAPVAQKTNLSIAEHMKGQTLIKSGHRVHFQWRMKIDKDRCDAQVHATGHGVTSNKPASGLWVMPTNPKELTEITGVEKDRLMKAMQILSERRGVRVTRVAPWELDQLEREGLIPSLQPPPSPSH